MFWWGLVLGLLTGIMAGATFTFFAILFGRITADREPDQKY